MYVTCFNIFHSSKYSKRKTKNVTIIRDSIAYWFMNFNKLKNTREKRYSMLRVAK
jgi:hypothetical protein